MELLIALNPDPDSRLPFLLRLPLAEPMVFRTSGTWPRTTALYCYPLPAADWPQEPQIVERVPVRSCKRRGAAVDLVLDRARENRSQIVFTTARGRDAVFWQSARTRKQARPNVRTPTARAAGLAQLQIVADSHERYPWKFTTQQASTVTRALPCGDYGLIAEGRLVAAVERKSLADLVTSLTGGTLRYALGELASLPRAAVVVEDRYSQIFTLTRVRPALVADGLAELQIRWPSVPIVRSPPAYPPWPPKPPTHPPHPNPPPPKSVSGRARPASPCPTAAGSAPKSAQPGTTPTNPDSHQTTDAAHADRGMSERPCPGRWAARPAANTWPDHRPRLRCPPRTGST